MTTEMPENRESGGPVKEPSWTQFVDGLSGFVARRVPRQDLDDVMQEVLLRIHRGASSVRSPERMRSRLFSVARRAVADYYRTRDRTQLDDSSVLDAIADPTAVIEERLARFEGDHSVHEEVLTWLRPIAEGLPERYRDALVMADFEGRTQREVAEQLGLSLSGAKSRVQRARRMLAAELESCCLVELGAEGRAQDFERLECDC